MPTCICEHAELLHIARNLVTTLGVRYRSCRHIGCNCPESDPAPAGEAASASSRPAGAPKPEGIQQI